MALNNIPPPGLLNPAVESLGFWEAFPHWAFSFSTLRSLPKALKPQLGSHGLVFRLGLHGFEPMWRRIAMFRVYVCQVWGLGFRLAMEALHLE